MGERLPPEGRGRAPILDGNVLRQRIEKHLRETGTHPTRFGRDAVRDPRFVFDLRRGREPQDRTLRRVNHYLDQIEASAAE